MSIVIDIFVPDDDLPADGKVVAISIDGSLERWNRRIAAVGFRSRMVLVTET